MAASVGFSKFRPRGEAAPVRGQGGRCAPLDLRILRQHSRDHEVTARAGLGENLLIGGLATALFRTKESFVSQFR
jgi:hypothetical protein